MASCSGSVRRILALAIVLTMSSMPADRVAFTQFLPTLSNTAEANGPDEAFTEGFQAYKHRDYAAAIKNLELVASNPSDIKDYALYYLGVALAANGDRSGAADAYRQLDESYPASVLANPAEIGYAELELELGHPELASVGARRVLLNSPDTVSDQNARLILARAASVQDQYSFAYDEARRLREAYPRGVADTAARALAYSILQAHPEVIDTTTLDYHRAEAALLVREGQHAAALEQLRAAFASAPPALIRADLYWLRAQALSGSDARAALLRYLELAPAGEHASAALSTIAHLYWRSNNTDLARRYFGRVAERSGRNDEAAEAQLEIGRTYEDDNDLGAARREYLRLMRRYPASEAADSARFRAAFMLYLGGRYGPGAAEFAQSRRIAKSSSDRDMYGYWYARSLERDGATEAARSIYREVAASTDSNYYPALAARRIAFSETPYLPAAAAADLSAGALPIASGSTQFHLRHIAAFRALGLPELEPAELRAIAVDNPAIGRFVIAEMQNVGDWYESIQIAAAMATRGEIDPATAERIRYPRGFWELVHAAALQHRLDPWLLAALIRQESLYNPQARSRSDARGLMQLLPSTAEHWAPAAGMSSSSSLDLYDPTVSIAIGTTYLKGLFEMFDGDPFKAIAAYNGGEHAVSAWAARYPGDDDQWVENISYRETRDYVKKVIGGMREYQLLYARGSAPLKSLQTVSSPVSTSAKISLTLP
jgi:soluble lytic murein transglycosylase